MELIILTGMSVAGKSSAVRYLEDLGFFCMDNVPPYVLPDLVSGFYKGRSGEGFGVSKLAEQFGNEGGSFKGNTWQLKVAYYF